MAILYHGYVHLKKCKATFPKYKKHYCAVVKGSSEGVDRIEIYGSANDFEATRTPGFILLRDAVSVIQMRSPDHKMEHVIQLNCQDQSYRIAAGSAVELENWKSAIAEAWFLPAPIYSRQDSRSDITGAASIVPQLDRHGPDEQLDPTEDEDIYDCPWDIQVTPVDILENEASRADDIVGHHEVAFTEAGIIVKREQKHIKMFPYSDIMRYGISRSGVALETASGEVFELSCSNPSSFLGKVRNYTPLNRELQSPLLSNRKIIKTDYIQCYNSPEKDIASIQHFPPNRSLPKIPTTPYEDISPDDSPSYTTEENHVTNKHFPLNGIYVGNQASYPADFSSHSQVHDISAYQYRPTVDPVSNQMQRRPSLSKAQDSDWHDRNRGYHSRDGSLNHRRKLDYSIEPDFDGSMEFDELNETRNTEPALRVNHTSPLVTFRLEDKKATSNTRIVSIFRKGTKSDHHDSNRAKATANHGNTNIDIVASVDQSMDNISAPGQGNQYRKPSRFKRFFRRTSLASTVGKNKNLAARNPVGGGTGHEQEVTSNLEQPQQRQQQQRQHQQSSDSKQRNASYAGRTGWEQPEMEKANGDESKIIIPSGVEIRRRPNPMQDLTIEDSDDGLDASGCRDSNVFIEEGINVNQWVQQIPPPIDRNHSLIGPGVEPHSQKQILRQQQQQQQQQRSQDQEILQQLSSEHTPALEREDPVRRNAGAGIKRGRVISPAERTNNRPTPKPAVEERRVSQVQLPVERCTDDVVDMTDALKDLDMEEQNADAQGQASRPNHLPLTISTNQYIPKQNEIAQKMLQIRHRGTPEQSVYGSVLEISETNSINGQSPTCQPSSIEMNPVETQMPLKSTISSGVIFRESYQRSRFVSKEPDYEEIDENEDIQEPGSIPTTANECSENVDENKYVNRYNNDHKDSDNFSRTERLTQEYGENELSNSDRQFNHYHKVQEQIGSPGVNKMKSRRVGDNDLELELHALQQQMINDLNATVTLGPQYQQEYPNTAHAQHPKQLQGDQAGIQLGHIDRSQLQLIQKRPKPPVPARRHHPSLSTAHNRQVTPLEGPNKITVQSVSSKLHRSTTGQSVKPTSLPQQMSSPIADSSPTSEFSANAMSPYSATSFRDVAIYGNKHLDRVQRTRDGTPSLSELPSQRRKTNPDSGTVEQQLQRSRYSYVEPGTWDSNPTSRIVYYPGSTSPQNPYGPEVVGSRQHVNSPKSVVQQPVNGQINRYVNQSPSPSCQMPFAAPAPPSSRVRTATQQSLRKRHQSSETNV